MWIISVTIVCSFPGWEEGEIPQLLLPPSVGARPVHTSENILASASGDLESGWYFLTKPM